MPRWMCPRTLETRAFITFFTSKKYNKLKLLLLRPRFGLRKTSPYCPPLSPTATVFSNFEIEPSHFAAVQSTYRTNVVPLFKLHFPKIIESYCCCCTWVRQRRPLTDVDAKKRVTTFSKLCFRHWFGFVHALGTGVELWNFLWQGKRGWNFHVPTPSWLASPSKKGKFYFEVEKKWKLWMIFFQIEQACRYGTRL